MIAIVDYDAGNLRSVEKAFEYLGYDVCVTADPAKIIAADAVVLPGVGAFGDGIRRLRRSSLAACVTDAIHAGRPFLGICLGLQLLYEGSEEDPSEPGLGILPGWVVRLPGGEGRKVPQIGWNQLNVQMSAAPEFSGMGNGSYAYFVHSYYAPADADFVSASVEYGVDVTAAVRKDNVCAFQFHPEKSGKVGLLMLDNLAKSWGLVKK